MAKRTRRLFVRIYDAEFNRAKQLADSMDMPLSGLVRTLLGSVALGTAADENSIIVVDRHTAIGLRMEMRRWGYHYNQTVHALNSIAYYLRLNEMDSDEVIEELDKVNMKTESMNDGVILLREEVATITAHPVLYL